MISELVMYKYVLWRKLNFFDNFGLMWDKVFLDIFNLYVSDFDLNFFNFYEILFF